MDTDDLAGWLRLTLTDGIGNVTARRLLGTFGLPDSVFAQTASTLREVANASQAAALCAEPAALADQLALTRNWLSTAPTGVQRGWVALGDPAYPASLLGIEDPPLMLYWQGQAPAPGTPLDKHWTRAIAMVGSRNPTPQGTANARQFAKALASSGLTVVSGMALGIDGAAHEGAMEGAAPGQVATVAVVGTGLDRVYPRRHLDLAHRIVQCGLILSEYPLRTPPLAANFPKRNRIISGLSRGTLVVEATLQSGSLITARMALEQGADVFAIPGSIHAPQARGCHALIKQGAKLVESAQDVLEELHFPVAPASAMEPAHTASPDNSGGLLDAIGHDPVSLDALVARTGTDAARLQVQLLELELDGQLARLPGGLFQRMASA